MTRLTAAEKQWLQTVNQHTFTPPPPPQLEAAQVKALIESEIADGKSLEILWGISINETQEAGTRALQLIYPAQSTDERIIFVLDTVTHMHKHDMTPLILQQIEIEGTPVHAAVFQVPSDIVSTAGMIRTSQSELDAITDRGQWRELFSRTEPLSARGQDLPSHVRTSVITAESSVLELLPPADSASELSSTSFTLPDLAESVQVALYTPEAPEHLVIALDGDQHLSNGLLNSLEETPFSATTAVLFLWAEGPFDRAKLFAERDLFAALLQQHVLPWAQSLTVLPDATHRIIAGGSLGGLAAAELCRYYPHIARCATVQSASWWWNNLSNDITEGTLLVEWKKADTTPLDINLFVEVGAYEGYLLSWNRAFRKVLQEQGITHTYREYSGGHDYACWSRGIVDSLHYFTQK